MFTITKDREEILNVISHALGVILSTVGVCFLFYYNRNTTPYSTLSICIYSISLIILYLASTVYHLFSNTSVREKTQIGDHVGIFFLIAGTYTPVCLITLEQTSGWTMFYIIWGIAIVGTFLKVFFLNKIHDGVSLFLYIAMGWIIVFDYKNLITQMPHTALMWLIIGGLFYTVGTIFYAFRFNYAHFIWHLFVLAGSISHYIMIILIV